MRIDRYLNNEHPNRIGSVKRNSSNFNLLRFKPIRALFLWKGFPYIFQVVMLIIFLALIVLGWQVFTPENVNDKLFAKTNLVTLTIWGIWWPLMIWFSVLLGRVWCMVCPLELVSNISERIGRKIGITQRALNKWIRSGSVIVSLYCLIQLLIAGIHLHRLPAYTSFFLMGLLALSAFVGIFYKDRAFCIGFCPIGMLLNAYGRGGMLAVRAGSNESCEECTGKDCILTCNKNKVDSRSCPSLLNPPKLNSNKDCIVCGQCIKSCKPDNMQLLMRRPFDKNDAREEKANWALTIFIMLVSGFVTYELTTEWNTAKEIFLIVPNYLTKLFGLSSIGGLIKGIWTLGIFPLISWSFLGLISVLAKGSGTIFDAWRELALPTVIIISAGHLIKATAKLNTWLGYLPESLNNTFGEKSTNLYASGINLPTSFTDISVVSVIGMILLSLSFGYSLREEKIIYNRYFNSHFAPKLVLFLFYSVVVIGIGLK
jgi:polyferredoxin